MERPGYWPLLEQFFSIAAVLLLLCSCQTSMVPTNQPLPQNAQGMPT
jgi:hypothetical protein